MAKKAADTEKPNTPGYLDWFAQPDPEETQKQTAAAADPKVTALEAQVAALTAQLARPAPAIPASVFTQQQAPMAPTFDTEPNLKDLPDPVTDPEGYGREMAKRFSDALGQREAAARWQAQQQQEQTDKMDALLEEFQDKYPQFADDEDLIELASRKVATRQKRKGIDPVKYMLMQSDQFFGEVVAEIQKIAPGRGNHVEDTEEEDDRTSGIPGGLESGASGSGTRKAAPAEDPFSPWREFQEKSGFHR